MTMNTSQPSVHEAFPVSKVMNTYKRFPVNIVRGAGSTVWDEEGISYLDCTSGLAVCNLGHVPQAVHDRVQEQLHELWHCSNLFHIPIQEKLAKLLTAHTGFDGVFFCNSGAEANEAAIKLARLYGQSKGKTEIVTFQKSFHGRTLATLTATGQEKIHKGFEPLVAGFQYAPFNDGEALSEVITEQTSAVIVEPVQGEGGVVPADRDWLKRLEEQCRKRGALLIVDEIQTGLGRTGTLFAHEAYGIQPDAMTIAKGLGSGFPVGALLAKEQAAELFQPGTHGSTFGGNPLACAAAEATVKVLTETFDWQAYQAKIDWLSTKLQEVVQASPAFLDVRGKGFLQGIVTDKKAADIVTEMRREGVLVLIAGEDVVRILPPLTITEEELQTLVSALERVGRRIGHERGETS